MCLKLLRHPADAGSNDRITELEKVCAAARQKPQNPKMFAETIFPGDTLDMNITYWGQDTKVHFMPLSCERTANIAFAGSIHSAWTFAKAL
jgi:hypothetical protein